MSFTRTCSSFVLVSCLSRASEAAFPNNAVLNLGFNVTFTSTLDLGSPVPDNGSLHGILIPADGFFPAFLQLTTDFPLNACDAASFWTRSAAATTASRMIGLQTIFARIVCGWTMQRDGTNLFSLARAGFIGIVTWVGVGPLMCVSGGINEAPNFVPQDLVPHWTVGHNTTHEELVTLAATSGCTPSGCSDSGGLPIWLDDGQCDVMVAAHSAGSYFGLVVYWIVTAGTFLFSIWFLIKTIRTPNLAWFIVFFEGCVTVGTRIFAFTGVLKGPMGGSFAYPTMVTMEYLDGLLGLIGSCMVAGLWLRLASPVRFSSRATLFWDFSWWIIGVLAGFCGFAFLGQAFSMTSSCALGDTVCGFMFLVGAGGFPRLLGVITNLRLYLLYVNVVVTGLILFGSISFVVTKLLVLAKSSDKGKKASEELLFWMILQLVFLGIQIAVLHMGADTSWAMSQDVVYGMMYTHFGTMGVPTINSAIQVVSFGRHA